MSSTIAAGLFVLGGAVLGAVVTALFNAYQNKRNRARSELSIRTGVATRLVEVDSSISEIVQISIHGQSVPAVYTLDTTVVNSGTQEILQGHVDVALRGDSRVLAVDLVECPRGARDAVSLETQDAGAGFRFQFEYMNARETFLIRSLLSGRPSSVIPTFRKTRRRRTHKLHGRPLRPGLDRPPGHADADQRILHSAAVTPTRPQHRRQVRQPSPTEAAALDSVRSRGRLPLSRAPAHASLVPPTGGQGNQAIRGSGQARSRWRHDLLHMPAARTRRIPSTARSCHRAKDPAGHRPGGRTADGSNGPVSSWPPSARRGLAGPSRKPRPET